MQDIHRYNEKTSSIERIDFSVLGNKEILNMSVLGRDTPGLIVPDLYFIKVEKFSVTIFKVSVY